MRRDARGPGRSSVAPQANECSPRSILVVIDDSDASGRALANAVELAEAARGRLTLIHVLAPPRVASTAGYYLAALPGDSEEFGLGLLQRAEAAVHDRVPVHTILRRGRVADEIRGRVEAAQHDLVVIGRPQRWLSRVLVGGGPSSRSILGKSPARVVVVD